MINNILKKIEKANEVQNVELEKHNIELALIDELNEKTKEARIIFDNQHNAGIDIKKAQELLFNALNLKSNELKKYILVAKELQALMAKQETIYKELGLSIREDKTYGNAWKMLDHYSAKDAESYLNTVKDLLTQKKYIQ